jgi:hypothetical protein
MNYFAVALAITALNFAPPVLKTHTVGDIPICFDTDVGDDPDHPLPVSCQIDPVTEPGPGDPEPTNPPVCNPRDLLCQHE